MTPEEAETGEKDRPSSIYEGPGGVRIDFHSAEFNRIDDLNDWSRDYRSFESLEGVVTSDMRHHAERLGTADHKAPAAAGKPSSARVETREDDEGAGAPPPELIIVSQGRTLIIDSDRERAIACARTLREKKLTCSLLITGREDIGPLQRAPGGFAVLCADNVSVRGAFGDFTAIASVRGEQVPPGEQFGDGTGAFDLVLDLGPVPSFAAASLPMGYYAPAPDPAALGEVLTEMAEMRGRFKKPQFISLREKGCYHGRSRALDCRQCMEACPVGAIRPAGRAVAVNHYLCQGCGVCALVCPADAINMIEPLRGVLLSALRNKVQARGESANPPAVLVISGPGTTSGFALPGMNETDDGRVAILELEQIAFVGPDMLLAAIAYGAGTVLVICGDETPSAVRKAVECEVLLARAVLKGLGLPEEAVGCAAALPGDIAAAGPLIAAAGPGPHGAMASMEAGTFLPDHDKRTCVRLAAQHLYDQSGCSGPTIILPEGASFGALSVAGSCTLCMACASVCPTGALSAGGDLPRLTFRESECHQCGLCAQTCPEGAIRLLPRMLCDPAAIEAPVTLREAESFRCVECGKAFASPAMIDRMKEKLKGHRMYAEERQMRRLQMCAPCRTRDALMSEDMKLWNMR
jgi:ferredoxin